MRSTALSATILILIAGAWASAEDAVGPAQPPSGHEVRPARAKEHQAPEAKLRVADIRVSLGGQHGPKHVHEQYTAGAGSLNPSGNNEYDVTRDQNGGGILEVAFEYGRLHDGGGLVWGAGLRTVGHTLDLKGGSSIPQTQNLSYGTFGLIGNVGYGYAFTPNWHAEVGPFASVGGASMEWFDQDATGTYRADTATGGYVQGGLRAGTYVALWKHLVLGFELEYSGTLATMEVDHSASSAKSKLTVHESGMGGLFAIGYRF